MTTYTYQALQDAQRLSEYERELFRIQKYRQKHPELCHYFDTLKANILKGMKNA
jgi:hypothetical protein